MRDNLSLAHLHLETGPDRPWRGAVVIVLTLIIYTLIGMVAGWLARAWWGPLA